MDNMPIRAWSSTEMCYDTTRQKIILKSADSGLQIECCPILLNLVIYTHYGIEALEEGNFRKLKKAA
jgi:hypothetical protein